MKTSTIYFLADPRKTNDIEKYRYIGKTSSKICKRLCGHIYDARKTNKKQTHKRNWIRKLLREGTRPIIIEIETVSEGQSKRREIHWIAYFRAKGYNLTNATDGGEGTCGRIVSQSTKNKVRNTMLKQYAEGRKPAMLNKNHSDESKQQMSKSTSGKKNPMYGKTGTDNPNFGKKHTLEVREKWSEGRMGDKNPMYGKKGENSPNHGKKHSEDAKEKMRKAQLGCKLSNKTKQKIAGALRGRTMSEETRRKIGESHRGRTITEKSRQKMRDAQRKWRMAKKRIA